MDESRSTTHGEKMSSISPSEKENLDPFPLFGGSSGNTGLRMKMMPLEVQRLINENSSSTSPAPPHHPSSSPPSTGSPRGTLKSILRYDPSLSSPPSASSTPYIKITAASSSCEDTTSRLLFRTPGRSSSSTSNHTLSSSSKTRTPSGPRFNPFETGRENLHLPIIMSPSLFATVQSPSQENNDDHFWSLEDRAALFPVHISEDSPWKQEERKLDPETEIKTQEALNHYFDHHHQITSPLTDTNVTPNIPSFPCDASTQTELSFPPKLPEEVENILAKYTQSVAADNSSISNVSLRRKLFSNMKGEDFDETVEDESSVSGEEDREGHEASSPIRIMSPGKVIITPPRKHSASIEKEGMLCSFTPPLSFTRRTSGALTQIMDSPLFSPIGRTTTEGMKKLSSPRKSMSDDVVLMQSVIMEEPDGDCTDMSKSLFERSRSQCASRLDDQNISNMDTYSAQSSPLKPQFPLQKNEEEDEDKKSSTKLTLDNLTSSMTFHDVSEVTLPTNYSSSTTGYVTGNSNNHPSLSTIAESVGRLDSGMVSGGGDKSNAAPFDFFHSVHNTNSCAKPKSYMVSYGGGEEGSSDISVGFPLGSSTPTKQ